MGKIAILLLFLTSINTFCYSQEYESINDSIYTFIHDGRYVSASNKIVEYALYLNSIGDKESSLDYQIWNCNLVEENLDYFIDHGLTIEEYFANREMVCILYRDLGQKTNAIKTYLSIINDMKIVAPNLIPFFTNFIAPILASYKEPPLCDSIYSLSSTLDVIKDSKYEKKDIEDFVKVANYFNMNRCYLDKMEECDPWFDRYVGFIDSLDQSIYKDEVLNYNMNYIDILYLRASNAAAREKDDYKAISLYEKAIETLGRIKLIDPKIQLRIASYNSEIGKEFFLIGDKVKSKIYFDKALKYALLFNGTVNLEYCSLLSNIALNFWNIHQSAEAASIKETEIALREKTLLKPSISDYAVLMMYNTGQSNKNITIGNNVIDTFGDTINASLTDVYGYLAEAYSELMYQQIINGEDYSENRFKHEYFFDKASEMFELNKSHFQTHNRINQIQAFLLSLKAKHLYRLGDYNKSLELAEQAFLSDRNIDRLFLVCSLSAQCNNEQAMNFYLPVYYEYLETDLKTMLPLLGSVESEGYLQLGEHPIYRFIDWGAINPKDSLCLSLAYNSAILTKNLYLNSSSIIPFLTNESLYSEYDNLSSLKDLIYKDKDLNNRLLILHEYELKERELRQNIIENINSSLFVKWNSVQEKLDTNEVAIEFIEYGDHKWPNQSDVSGKRYGALIISKTSPYPAFVNLFGVEEAKAVYEQQPKSYSNNLGNNLFEKLWGELDPFINDASKVYFSPIGLLSLINIESLMDGNGVAAFDRYSLSRVSSTKQIISQKQHVIESAALFGGVEYTKKKDYLPTFTLDSLNTRGNWSYLAETLGEVNEIESEIKQDKDNICVYKYIGENATEEQFKNICKSCPSILHIASHGFYIPELKRSKVPYYNRDDTARINDNLFFSGLVFAGGQDAWNNSTFEIEANDGILSSYEISKLNLRKTDLVVLSACETGNGDISYDGIIGLQRGFKNAGANSIIMSLWKVDDAATSLLMVSFYRSYLKTGSKDAAFKEAQQIVREEYPDPYYWASFILLD